MERRWKGGGKAVERRWKGSEKRWKGSGETRKGNGKAVERQWKGSERPLFHPDQLADLPREPGPEPHALPLRSCGTKQMVNPVRSADRASLWLRTPLITSVDGALQRRKERRCRREETGCETVAKVPYLAG